MTLSRTAINRLKHAGYHDTGLDAWVRPEVEFSDMGRACGLDGYIMVEAVETSFDYLKGNDTTLTSIIGDRDYMRNIFRKGGRRAFREMALWHMQQFGIADPSGYGDAEWTVKERHLTAAIDMAIRIQNGQYVNLPEVKTISQKEAALAIR